MSLLQGHGDPQDALAVLAVDGAEVDTLGNLDHTLEGPVVDLQAEYLHGAGGGSLVLLARVRLGGLPDPADREPTGLDPHVHLIPLDAREVQADVHFFADLVDVDRRGPGLGPGDSRFRVHIPCISGRWLTAALLVFVDVMKELPATLIMRPFNFNTLAVRAFELAEDEQLAESAPAALSIVGVVIVPVILLTLAIARSRPGRLAG